MNSSIMSIEEYFRYLLKHKKLLTNGIEVPLVDRKNGICINVCNYTDDTLEVKLQEWLCSYFKTIEVDTYPFGVGSGEDKRSQYLCSNNKYSVETQDGLQRWEFIEYSIKNFIDNQVKIV